MKQLHYEAVYDNIYIFFGLTTVIYMATLQDISDDLQNDLAGSRSLGCGDMSENSSYSNTLRVLT